MPTSREGQPYSIACRDASVCEQKYFNIIDVSEVICAVYS